MPTPKDLFGKSYKQQLASTEWNTFSSGIRKRRGGSCECCRRTDVITQVHHIVYEPGKDLHEAAESDVILLCEFCHKSLHEELNKFRRFVFRYMTPQSFVILNRALAVAMVEYQPLVFAHAFAEIVGNEHLIENHARAYGMETARDPNAEMKREKGMTRSWRDKCGRNDWKDTLKKLNNKTLHNKRRDSEKRDSGNQRPVAGDSGETGSDQSQD